MADMSPKLAKAFLDMSATYYPERLGMFVLVDTPAVFSVLWNAIEKLVVSVGHKHTLCIVPDGLGLRMHTMHLCGHKKACPLVGVADGDAC